MKKKTPIKKATQVKRMDSVQKQQQRSDGWANIVTQVGTKRDKRTAANVKWEHRDPEEYEQLYAGDELASRIVNVVPEEALRNFVEWTDVDPEQAELVVQRTEALQFRGALEKTWRWARAYGGALLYVVTDAPDPSQPYQPGERVIALQDLSRYDLRVMSTDIEMDFGKPNYGHPNLYFLSVQMGVSSKVYPIHWTRVERFDGYIVPRRTFIRNNYWHDSILNRLFNAIRNYQTANDAAASVLQDFSVGVYKMKNLAQLIGADREQEVIDRLDLIQYARSSIKAMILDADSEDYSDTARSVDGMSELLTKQANRLVAATEGIPHTKLLGESPDGSSATGNSTTQQWYDYVKAQQDNYLRPRMKSVLDKIFPELKGTLKFKFKSLYQMTELEEADLRNKQAQTDVAYISAGVLDPSEVANSRFGGEQYSIETELDFESRALGIINPGNTAGDDQFSAEQAQIDPSQSGFGAQNDPSAQNDPQGNPDDININFGKAAHESDSRTDANDSPLAAAPDPNLGTYALRNATTPYVTKKQEPNVSISMSQPVVQHAYDQPQKNTGAWAMNRPNPPQQGDSIIAPSNNNPGTTAELTQPAAKAQADLNRLKEQMRRILDRAKIEL